MTASPVLRAQCELDEVVPPVFPARWLGASVSVDGTTVLAGSPGPAPQIAIGHSAFVYELTGSGWVETGSLFDSTAESAAQGGASVSLSGDVAVVGAPTDAVGGAVTVWKRIGVDWALWTKLTASDDENGLAFGRAVWTDGATIFVGAPSAANQSGVVYQFDLIGPTWVEVDKLTAPGGKPGDLFGFSVHAAGDLLIVGAPRDDGVEIDSGSATIFERIGMQWLPSRVLEPDVAPKDGGFGHAVGVSGQVAVVGACPPGEIAASGVAYVFEQSGDRWSQTAALRPDDATPGDRFGHAVSILADRILVGAPFADAPNLERGAAYSYERDGDLWTLVETLTSSTSEKADWFGYSVAQSASIAAVGLPMSETTKGDSDLGAVTIFAFLDPATWMDLGGAIDLGDDAVCLHAFGTLEPGTQVVVAKNVAKFANLVVGTSVLNAPFKGGTLVPQPDLVIAQGGFVSATMPALPSGTTLVLQSWIPFFGLEGYVSSNALLGVVP